MTAFPISVQEIYSPAGFLTFCLYIYKAKIEWMQNEKGIIKSSTSLLNILATAFFKSSVFVVVNFY